MLTFFASYKLIVLTRMVWSVLALSLGAVIGKYKPKGFKNIAICVVTCAGCLAWFWTYLVIVVLGMDLF